ncbi:hypothetical protein LINGRAPRIM_LOCUS275 [Linum grandiflorum]
MLQFRYLPRV